MCGAADSAAAGMRDRRRGRRRHTCATPQPHLSYHQSEACMFTLLALAVLFFTGAVMLAAVTALKFTLKLVLLPLKLIFVPIVAVVFLVKLIVLVAVGAVVAAVLIPIAIVLCLVALPFVIAAAAA